VPRPCFSLDPLQQVASDIVCVLSGFDRVMANRFPPDGSGGVIAESLDADVGSHLHLLNSVASVTRVHRDANRARKFC
jgi:light-regulated signal transduction histidine kinase (bacteriophytochrome)